MTQPTDESIADKIEALAAKATIGDLATAQRHVAEETVECPCCHGDAVVQAADYCNFDGKALGVQFYGIGSEFGAHEALWTTMMQNLPDILAALRRPTPAGDAVEDWEGTLRYCEREWRKEREHMCRQIAELRAAIAAMGGAGWRPWSEQPAGDTAALLYSPVKWKGEPPSDATCSTALDYEIAAFVDGEWIEPDTRHSDFGEDWRPQPTHWMPIPTPEPQNG